jgi:hypothetical protein
MNSGYVRRQLILHSVVSTPENAAAGSVGPWPERFAVTKSRERLPKSAIPA